MSDESAIARRYRLLAPHLTEHELRIWAAAEAASYGEGGIATLARITGIRRRTISRAQKELDINPAANTPANHADPQPADSEH